MAYSTSNPPKLIVQAMSGPRIFAYGSTEAGTAVDADGFFSNGYQLGMRANDIVIVTNSALGTVTSHVVLSAQSTGVDLGDGTTIGSTADAD